MIIALWAVSYLILGLLLVGVLLARNGGDDEVGLGEYALMSVLWPFSFAAWAIHEILHAFDRYGDIMPVLRNIFGGGR